MPQAPSSGHTFAISVDGEDLTVSEHELAPAEIMSRVGLDVNTHYLVEIEGAHRQSFEGRNDTPIHIHEKLKLVSVYTGPTTVS
jgi:hypothetical protein